MTVQATIPYQSYIANGRDTNFYFSFYVENIDSLVVKINSEITGRESYIYLKEENAIQFFDTPEENQVIEVFRQTALERSENYDTYSNRLRPETLNNELDRVWHSLQEHKYKVDQYDLDYNYILNQVRPIETGGTGANTVSEARFNLDVYNKQEVLTLVQTGGAEEVLSISNGGTGATTIEEARENLRIYSKEEVQKAIDNKSIPIISSLDSDSDIDALSASMGKELNDRISAASIPKSFIRATFCFNPTQRVGSSYKSSGQSSSTRVTLNNHGLKVGDSIYINYVYSIGPAREGAINGYMWTTSLHKILEVDTNTFTFNGVTRWGESSETITSYSFSCTIYYSISTSENINALTEHGIGDYSVSLTANLPSTDYTVAFNAVGGEKPLDVRLVQDLSLKNNNSFRFNVMDKDQVLTEPTHISLAVIL